MRPAKKRKKGKNMTKRIECTGRGIKPPPQIVDDLTRREFLIGAGLIALAPGCGSGEGTDENTPSANARTIEHPLGTTEVPGRPERIVSLSGNEITDILIALDRKPIASMGDGDFAPALEGETEGIETLSYDSDYQPNLEALAALDPDLILGYSYNEPVYEELSRIAPTVILSDERDFKVWVDNVARATFAEEEAEEAMEEYEARVAEVREKVEGAKISVVRPQDEALLLYGPPSNAGMILEELGLEIQPVPEEAADWSGDGTRAIGELSLEYIPELTGEHIFIISYDLEEGTTPEDLLRQPIWQSLDAVKEGRAHPVEGIAWTNHGILGAIEMIDEVERAIAGDDSA
jgi:iron complex transport system substrate-binding protein